MRAVLPILCVAALGAARAHAHDFWIEPASYRPQVNAPLALKLRVGESFQGDSVPRQESKIERFVAIGPRGEKPIVGLDGRDPAGAVRLEAPGTYVLGYRSKHSSVELEPEKFQLYLEQEGLQGILAQRLELGEANDSAPEIYSRCAKSIVAAGVGGEVAGFDRVLGFTLELVPLKNPSSVRRDEELPVKLLFQDRPLEGAQVVAMSADQPAQRQTLRTGKDGVVTFKLNAHGAWLVKAVHMVRAPDLKVAKWESFWASLTFENGADLAR